MLNLFFSAQPRQIRALRSAIGWNRADLAHFLGVYFNKKKSDSNTVARWEKGESRPHPVLAERMRELAIKFSDEYLRALTASDHS